MKKILLLSIGLFSNVFAGLTPEHLQGLENFYQQSLDNASKAKGEDKIPFLNQAANALVVLGGYIDQIEQEHANLVSFMRSNNVSKSGISAGKDNISLDKNFVKVQMQNIEDSLQNASKAQKQEFAAKLAADKASMAIRIQRVDRAMARAGAKRARSAKAAAAKRDVDSKTMSAAIEAAFSAVRVDYSPGKASASKPAKKMRNKRKKSKSKVKKA